jgi:hypothetical protein
MWMPHTEQEIVNLVKYNALTMTTTFAARREVPTQNVELAAEIAAMANDGGVIIYGIDARFDGRYTRLAPVNISAGIERIRAIVATSIAEPPAVTIQPIGSADDPDMGYLVLAIPASVRAPHMVVAEGDYRYYGRTPSGVTMLPEAAIARLYSRRLAWESHAAQSLDGIIERLGPPPQEGLGYLHLACLPMLTDGTFLDTAFAGIDLQRLLNEMLATAASEGIFPRKYGIDFPLNAQWERHPEGWLASFSCGRRRGVAEGNGSALRLWLMFDGSAYLFWGGGTKRMTNQVMIFDAIITALAIRLMAFVGSIYEKGGYLGPVELQLRLTGTEGGISFSESTDRLTMGEVPSISYNQARYNGATRAGSNALTTESLEITRALMSPLVRAIRQDCTQVFAEVMEAA